MKKGSHHTIETKRKLRKNHNKTSGFKGKHTEETKRKISEAHKGKKHLSQQGFQKGHSKPENAYKFKKGNIPWNYYKIQKICLICGKEFKVNPYRKKKKYCSMICYGKARIGKYVSEETKKKMSEAQEKENHWNWRGGITPLTQQIRHSFKYRQWRSDVFTRDDFTCQKCEVRGGYLEADHYPKKFSEIFHENKIKTLEEALNCEELWNINNGRTLCKKCHHPEKI